MSRVSSASLTFLKLIRPDLSKEIDLTARRDEGHSKQIMGNKGV